MKKVAVSSLLLASSLSFGATTLTCKQLSGYETAGYKVFMQYSAEITTINPSKVELTNIKLKYNIDSGSLDGNTGWGKADVSFNSITNTPGYNPRKYKDHMKFDLLVDTRTSFGGIDLIIPKAALFSKYDMELKSYAIMTSINDSMGGSVELNCKLDAPELNTFSSTRAKLDTLLSEGDNESAEGILSYEIIKGETNLNTILGKIIKDYPLSGLTHIKMNNVSTNERRIDDNIAELFKAIDFDYEPFFCESIMKEFSYTTPEFGVCMAKTAALYKTVLKDMDMQSLSIIEAQGDEWGMWESVYLVGRNFDNEESIIIYFDLVHEI